MWELDHRIEKAEHWRIDAFKLWCWKKLLRFPWTARGSNQSIIKEINPEYSLEGLMLKVKLQYFGHLLQRADSLEKPLMLGKIEGIGEKSNRWWGGWMASLTQWRWVWANSANSEGQFVGVLQFMELQSWTRLSNWTTSNLDLWTFSIF